MKSADLFIGLAVAYDRYESRDRHEFVESYVIAIRPKGNKSSYWDMPNGNNNTVGIAYKQPKWTNIDGQPTWKFSWVRPATIHYDWVTYTDIQNAQKVRDDSYAAARKAAKADRIKRIAALPNGILEALGMQDYSKEDLIESGSRTVNITVEKLEAIVKVVQANSPDQIQREVEAALALL